MTTPQLRGFSHVISQTLIPNYYLKPPQSGNSPSLLKATNGSPVQLISSCLQGIRSKHKRFHHSWGSRSANPAAPIPQRQSLRWLVDGGWRLGSKTCRFLMPWTQTFRAMLQSLGPIEAHKPSSKAHRDWRQQQKGPLGCSMLCLGLRPREDCAGRGQEVLP